jgi:hypothetical protein
MGSLRARRVADKRKATVLLRRGALVGMCAVLSVGVWPFLAPALRDDLSTTRGQEHATLAAGVDSSTPVAQRRPRRRHRPTSVYDGIPWDTAAVALLLSAAIGAAGAKIYVGITGPDD